MLDETPPFPGGSKQRVNRAGENVRRKKPTPEDLEVIEEWRAAHRSVLNTFQALLRNRTRDTNIVVAQRHKRRNTIFDKLRRFPKMNLSRMDDVAGCRLIFPNIHDLYELREQVHSARFNHKLRNDPDRYDYISQPKETGYRGVHDVYEYNVRSESGARYKGLLIELQYRTTYQHAWATCVELIGFITENRPKFEEGHEDFLEIFRLASEIIARTFEGTTSCYGELKDGPLVRRFLSLDRKLNFLLMLSGLNAADSTYSNRKNIILMISESDQLEMFSYRDATEALDALFELEQQNPGKDIVLVRADSSEQVRFAFKNYFSDAQEFIDLIKTGCESLAGRKIKHV